MSIDRLAEVRQRRANAEAGGGPERMQRQHKEGKLSARERIDLLLDEGTFEEMDKLVRHRCHRIRHGRAGGGWRRLRHRLRAAFTDAWCTSSRRISRCLAGRCRKPMRRKSARSWTSR